MNKLQMPDQEPRRRRIQDTPDLAACVAAALDTTQEQRPDAGIEDALDRLREID